MNYLTLVSTNELAAHLEDPDWAIVDCRFTLGENDRGRRDYLKAHIPGAVYAHLDDDLCSPVIPGETGRHPLPEVQQLVQIFSEWGIDSNVQVVVYDDYPQIGLATAARLWWSLRWLGHEKVAVLDGGWDRWVKDGYPQKMEIEKRPRRDFVPVLRPGIFADTDAVDKMWQDPASRTVDSRSEDRFRGENETIDPVAGHIPNAVSIPYADNFHPDGLFRSGVELRSRFVDSLGGVTDENVVFYCGSGVTAAVNVLAMAHAGLGNARLYVGSWSEWITNPQRPVE